MIMFRRMCITFEGRISYLETSAQLRQTLPLLYKTYVCIISVSSPGAVRALNGACTYRVPLGVHLLLLELGELAAVVDDHEQLPDEKQG